jgi:hypothetical protein
MTTIDNPRSYWIGISDQALIDARRDWLTLGADMPWLAEKVSEIDDELRRRADYRARLVQV